MATMVAGAGRFGSGRIITGTIEMIRKDVWPVLVAYLVLDLATKFAYNYSDSPDAPFILKYIVLLVGVVAELFLAPVVVAIVIRPNGWTPWRAAFGVMLYMPFVIIMTLVAVIGVGLASLLLIIPGVMLSVTWSLALPALVAERLDPVRALSRSRALTKGFRWAIFFTYLIFFALWLGLMTGIWWMIHTLPAGQAHLATQLFSLIADFPIEIVLPVLGTAIYQEVRGAKEGGAPGMIFPAFG